MTAARRTGPALPAAFAAVTTLAAPAVASPAATPPRAAAPGTGAGAAAACTGTAPVVCHFDAAPRYLPCHGADRRRRRGPYPVGAETRRTVLGETPTAFGRTVVRAFAVDVREPGGEPTGAGGSPGLDLTFRGPAPLVADVHVAPRRPYSAAGPDRGLDRPRSARRPYTCWGQELPQYLRAGISVANHADSGESSQTCLDQPQLFPTVRPLIRRGDTVLIQLARNDKRTTEADYRANLTTMIDAIRAQGGRPVLVTPIVRRWFNADGTLDNGTALLVNGLGVDQQAQIRLLATERHVPLIELTALTRQRVEELGPDGSRALYLTDEQRDNPHTSERGATEYAAMVRDALRAQHLLPAGRFR
ncbi:carbohydrate esterase [Streptomyces laculatispora]|uniref:Carbohydrate esterase n=1 Tax=Streptomyces laculatispora TaxID=887464 RepID=A0ABY9IEK5_9ACTN|nr:carbohydrate esterase [Streptomyces laculatispora]WLQ44026.1 carbohydrate esterase [Streptomyces laculatispora]